MLPLLMFVLLSSHPHRTDQHRSQLLTRVHSEVYALCNNGRERSQLSNEKWMRHFRARIPKTEIGYLRRIQKSIDPRSEAACEIAFVLAYYQVDFDANLRQMLRTDYSNQYFPVSIVEGDVTEYFADFLYRRCPGLTALRIWLDTEVDGASAEEATGFWYAAWKRDRLGMLLAAAGSKMRIYHVALALTSAFEDPDPEDEKLGEDIVRHRIHRDLNRFCRSGNPKVARTARAVLMEMKSFE